MATRQFALTKTIHYDPIRVTALSPLEMLLAALWLASHVFFWLVAPTLLFARVRYGWSWSLVIASSIAMGWLFVNSAVFFQHRAVDESRRQDFSCFEQHRASPTSPASVGNVVVVDNPCPLVDYFIDEYELYRGLLLGPLTLLICLFPYWLLTLRPECSVKGKTTMIVVLTLGILAIEWAGLIRECMTSDDSWICQRPGGRLFPTITIAIAVTTASLVGTQLLGRRSRRA